MATIGSWGTSVVFSVSDSKILTFSGFTRSVTATWVSHSRIGQKDQTEFLRAGLQKVTFTMELNAVYGVKPRSVLEALEKSVEKGEINTLVIGGKRVGTNRWKITDVGETWDVILQKGQLAKAKVNVTMEEYL